MIKNMALPRLSEKQRFSKSQTLFEIRTRDLTISLQNYFCISVVRSSQAKLQGQ